jgi:hypothetical protein
MNETGVEYVGVKFGEGLLCGLSWRRDKGNIRVASERPERCKRCEQAERLVHAHGTYPRHLITIMSGEIQQIGLCVQRWYCPVCGRTMSTPPPQVLPYVASCSLVITIILWVDLADRRGIYSAKNEFIQFLLSEQTLQRYRRRAQAISLFTEHFIRRVVQDRMEPEPANEIMKGGLSPPEFWKGKYSTKTREELSRLWTGLWLLTQTPQTPQFYPSFILARAHTQATSLKRPFLI